VSSLARSLLTGAPGSAASTVHRLVRAGLKRSGKVKCEIALPGGCCVAWQKHCVPATKQARCNALRAERTVPTVGGQDRELSGNGQGGVRGGRSRGNESEG